VSVSFSADGVIGTITLDNPPANSYDGVVMGEFAAAVEQAIGSEARVVIVRSASERFFSAGGDVKKFIANDVRTNMDMVRLSHATFARMAAAPQVFIAFIAGHALGGGLELALACDLRVAAAGGYKLGTPEVTLGLLPGNGGTQRLSRLIGISRAMDLLLTGRTFTPEEGLALGVLNRVHPPESAEAELLALANRLASSPQQAIASIKRCVHEGADRRLEDGLRIERELNEALFASADAAEGMAAFVEKRDPVFA
jgi:enoyl-CoA hydratase/carnithine racemase